MNLGLQMLLGGLRKGSSVPSVVGEGFTLTAEEFESQHGTFYGSPNVNLTGIVIDDISIFPTPDTTPKVIRATLYDCIRWAGTRTYSVFGYSVPLLFRKIRHTDLDYRWEVVYEDDSPIEDEEGLLTAFTRENFNPYLDEIGPILGCAGRRPGIGYKIKASIFGKDGDLIRGANFERLLPAVSDNILPEMFYSYDTGNDGNDGGDPLGLAIVDGTYDDATRTIFAPGYFANYNHELATSGNYTLWYNKLKLLSANEAGFSPVLVEIESKTSDGAVVIKKALGSNYTGLTSSNGPKLTFDTAQNMIRKRLKIGGTYTQQTPFSMAYAGIREIIGYGNPIAGEDGGVARIVGAPSVDAFIDNFSNASANISGTTWFIFSFVKFDAEFQRTIAKGQGSANGGGPDAIRDAVLFFDHLTMTGSTGSQTYGFNWSGDKQYLHKNKLFWYGGEMNNLTNPEGTIDKKNGIYMTVGLNGWFSFIGMELKCDSDNSDLHHYLYSSYEMSNSHVTQVRAVEGSGANYVLNLNMTNDSSNISVVSNYFGQDGFGSGAKRGIDLSKTNQTSDDVEATDAYVIDNDFNVKISPIYWASVNSARIAFNRTWGGQAVKGLFEMLTGWHPSTFSARNYLDNNKVFGTKLINQQLGSQYVEATDNDVYIDTDNDVNDVPQAWLTEKESKFARNNFYAPNKTGSQPLKVGASRYSVEGFNALTEGDNTSTNSGWNKPDEGDFSTVTDSYFTDFSNDTIGELPAGFTLTRNSLPGEWQVVELAGEKVLRYLSSLSPARRGVAAPIAAHGVTEVYCEIRPESGTSLMAMFASDSPENEYGIAFDDNLNGLYTYKRVEGDYSNIEQDYNTITSNEFANIVFRITPGNINQGVPNLIQAKFWKPLIEPEPEFFNTPTDSSLELLGGWIGPICSKQNSPVYIRKIGIGINSQPAPRS